MQETFVRGDATTLIIPSHRVPEAIKELKKHYRGMAVPPSWGTSPRDLIDLLENLYFVGCEQENGDVAICDYISQDELDPMHNDILIALVGIVPAGSYLTYYDCWGEYNQLRYEEHKMSIVSGKVIFPEDDTYPFCTEVK